MIEEANHRFQRWATWILSGSNHISLGYGKNLCQKLLEGKGEFLPGAPRGSGLSNNHDPVALKVDGFLTNHCSRADRKIIKVFYLEQFLSSHEKAARLRIPRRTMYDQVERIQARLMAHCEPARD